MSGPVAIRQGRRFGCTRCAQCCREPGHIYFTSAEHRRMARHLDMSPSKFREQFEISWDIDADLWAIDASDGVGCPLLDREGRCRVHPVKPSQCRTFPFWDELLDDQSEWEEAKQYCPGVDAEDGRLYSFQEIQALRKGRGRTG